MTPEALARQHRHSGMRRTAETDWQLGRGPGHKDMTATGAGATCKPGWAGLEASASGTERRTRAWGFPRVTRLPAPNPLPQETSCGIAHDPTAPHDTDPHSKTGAGYRLVNEKDTGLNTMLTIAIFNLHRRCTQNGTQGPNRGAQGWEGVSGFTLLVPSKRM